MHAIDIHDNIIHLDILYSGKFLHGANFRGFHGWPHYHKNKNRESFNVGACAASLWGATPGARESKNRKSFFWCVRWHFRKSLHPQKFPAIQ